jgi:hypothetical protein
MNEYVEKGGSKYQHFSEINDRVLALVADSISRGIRVHDRDLQEWGLLEAERLGMTTFTGGHHWAENFKRRNKLVSRLPTKVVGMKKRKDPAAQELAIAQFHEQLRPALATHPRSQVFNTDQSGINLELSTAHSIRRERSTSRSSRRRCRRLLTPTRINHCCLPMACSTPR